MANDPTALEQLNQNGSVPIAKNKTDPDVNKLSTGMTLYKRETGMAFEIVNVSHANGIEHYNLRCSETGSCYYLSKYALEKNYAEEECKVETFGLRMVKRLSKMCQNK